MKASASQHSVSPLTALTKVHESDSIKICLSFSLHDSRSFSSQTRAYASACSGDEARIFSAKPSRGTLAESRSNPAMAPQKKSLPMEASTFSFRSGCVGGVQLRGKLRSGSMMVKFLLFHLLWLLRSAPASRIRFSETEAIPLKTMLFLDIHMHQRIAATESREGERVGSSMNS
ncbi:Toprim domain-containing protein [Psidium guajava]|nr:Toprim domain-containing protein [Psidium guajava]